MCLASGQSCGKASHLLLSAASLREVLREVLRQLLRMRHCQSAATADLLCRSRLLCCHWWRCRPMYVYIRLLVYAVLSC
jgi:hypothetical protein